MADLKNKPANYGNPFTKSDAKYGYPPLAKPKSVKAYDYAEKVTKAIGREHAHLTAVAA